MTLSELINLFVEDPERAKKARENLASAIMIIDQFVAGLYTFLDYLNRIDFEKIYKLPDSIKDAGNLWASYGWVPFLPTYSFSDILDTITAPERKEDADAQMLQYFENNGVEELFTKIGEYVCCNAHNQITWNEAVKCYEFGLYSACALSLFAIIDEAFLCAQGEPQGKERRKLAVHAVQHLYDSNKTCQLMVNSIAVKTIITNIFSNAKDFTAPETDLNRNYISHGMNKYIPDQVDCLKLFVLLYNIYLLFETKVFVWE